MDSSITDDFKAELADANKNKNNIICKHCGSVILLQQAAEYVQKTVSLPKPDEKDLNPDNFVEQTDFWLVKGIYTFENVGFLNTYQNSKYLICADCERGPIGYMDLETNLIYVAVNRVTYKPIP